MKRFVSVVLALVMMSLLVACGNDVSQMDKDMDNTEAGNSQMDPDTTNTEAGNSEEMPVGVVGQVVSSDIIELTVNNVKLSYYAIAPQTGSNGKTGNPDEACSASENEEKFFVARKGRTLVCLDFTLKNNDRGSLNTDRGLVSFSVQQNDNYAKVNGYDLNSEDGRPGLNLSFSPISVNGQDFVTNDTSNEIISAGDSVRIKVVGIIGFDADITAPFELVVSIDNSSGGEEQFVYLIG